MNWCKFIADFLHDAFSNKMYQKGCRLHLMVFFPYSFANTLITVHCFPKSTSQLLIRVNRTRSCMATVQDRAWQPFVSFLCESFTCESDFRFIHGICSCCLQGNSIVQQHKKVFISYNHSLLYNLHGNHDVELVTATGITRWQLPTYHDGN